MRNEPDRAEFDKMGSMNLVGDLLGPDDVQLDVDVRDATRLLERVASLLVRRAGLSESAILESLAARERLGSTALGHGVAIPHARMAQCNVAAAAFVRTKTAIPFDAPDRKPASLYLGLVVPKQANEYHLQLLATAATMFNDRAFRDLLRAAPTPGAVRELLRTWPDSPQSAGEKVEAAPTGPVTDSSGT